MADSKVADVDIETPADQKADAAAPPKPDVAEGGYTLDDWTMIGLVAIEAMFYLISFSLFASSSWLSTSSVAYGLSMGVINFTYALVLVILLALPKHMGLQEKLHLIKIQLLADFFLVVLAFAAAVAPAMDATRACGDFNWDGCSNVKAGAALLFLGTFTQMGTFWIRLMPLLF